MNHNATIPSSRGIALWTYSLNAIAPPRITAATAVSFQTSFNLSFIPDPA